MDDFSTQKNLDTIISSPDFKHFLYPANAFMARLKEEFLRTNRNGQSFAFLKIHVHLFDVSSYWNKNSLAIQSWKTSVIALLAEVKFIDVLGFLPDGGIGIILLYTDIKELIQIKKNILRSLYKAKLLNALRLKPKSPIFESFLHTGRGEKDKQKDDEKIRSFNQSSMPFFKLSNLNYEDVLPQTTERKFKTLVKRILDVTCTSLAVLVLLPIFLICALIVKCSDPKGPIIFKQTRVGKNGKLFTMYKFRSMYADAEERKKELEKFNETSGPTFKMKNDPRIYPLGRILRKFSLDELPQLFNILKGDMSIVGPRPPIPAETIHYTAWHNMRLAVTPGLTCLWQVSGRSNINFEDWMRLDNQYIRTHNTKTDLQLITKTFKVVLKGEGSY